MQAAELIPNRGGPVENGALTMNITLPARLFSIRLAY